MLSTYYLKAPPSKALHALAGYINPLAALVTSSSSSLLAKSLNMAITSARMVRMPWQQPEPVVQTGQVRGRDEPFLVKERAQPP